LPATLTTDILVAGGGIIGASIAWRLAQRGLSVMLCDSGRLGGEASWAGAGMLVPGSEFDQPGEWLDFALRSLKLYPSYVSELEAGSDLVIDFSQPGSLEIAADEHDWERLRQRLVAQRELGFRPEEVPHSELMGRIPSLDSGLAGAVFYPQEGQVDPRTVISALRESLTRLGAVIRENVKVHSVHARGHVTLDGGDSVEARRIVIAAGAWSSMLHVDGVQPLPAVFPVRGHLIGYQMEPGSLPHVLRFRHTYIVQRRSGYTIAGTSEEQVGFQRAVNPGTAQDIAMRAGRLWHTLEGRAFEAWTGFRPGTSEDGPLLGRWLGTRIWLAYGHYRNGILLAPVTAERITNEIMASLERD
jgi:glycine oxidase